jgi:hypothetical protein
MLREDPRANRLQQRSSRHDTSPIEQFVGESHDGSGAGDHDLPFVFGRKSHAVAPIPFSTRELGRLMVLRSRLQTGLLGEDGYVPQVA